MSARAVWHAVRRACSLSSIRARLAVGFGVVVLVFGLVTVRAVIALRTADREARVVLALSREEYDQAQRVVSAMTGELAAGMQYANGGSEQARARYEARGAELDSLRVSAMRLERLSPGQRAELEEIGRLQEAVEVRIGVARVEQVLGHRDRALQVLEAAATDLVGLDSALSGFRAWTSLRVADAQQSVSAATARSTAHVAAFGALALLLAMLFGLATGRAMAAPLAALLAHARALRGGDFGVRTEAARMPGEFALLGATMNEAAASLATLRAELTHQAFHDALTGLANRTEFRARAERALATAAAEGRPGRVAVLVLDLDGFKNVNDSLGHAAGDVLLIEVAARLLNATRGSDTVARLGGDEFAVLLEHVRDDGDAVVVAERVVATVRAPIPLEGAATGHAFVGASVGIARAVGDSRSTDVDALLRDADAAMYRAKAQGKGRCAVFEPSMHAAAVARLALESELRGALEQGEGAVAAFGDAPGLCLAYQPVVDVEDGRPIGVEALVRWRHERHGLMAPSDFLDVAEETGLVVPLGRWVLGEACRQGARWQAAQRAAGVPTARLLGVAVNVSSRQLHDPGFVEDVAAVLRSTPLARGTLTLEMTEHTVVRRPEAVRERLTELRALGVRIAVDDFGTGYSALGYLRQFPVDVLKIDKSFVDGIARGGSDAALARTIVALGDALEMRCVAEGVETAEQRAALVALGCPLAQGFHFARPLAPEAVDALVGVPRDEPVKALLALSALEFSAAGR
ncbi:MAG TPA: EAL domain-containing protein [Gemmatirosa sp.]